MNVLPEIPEPEGRVRAAGDDQPLGRMSGHMGQLGVVPGQGLDEDPTLHIVQIAHPIPARRDRQLVVHPLASDDHGLVAGQRHDRRLDHIQAACEVTNKPPGGSGAATIVLGGFRGRFLAGGAHGVVGHAQEGGIGEGGGLPDVRGAVAGGGQGEVLRGVEGDRVDGAAVTDVAEEALAGVDAPDARGLVRGGRSQERVAEIRDGNIPDSISVAL